MSYRVASLILAIGLASCASSPNRAQYLGSTALIDTNLPSAFVATAALPRIAFTNDPILTALIARVPQSPDVIIAASRLAQARARLEAARAGLLPQIGGTANVSTSSSDTEKTLNSETFGVNFDAKLDLFGKARTRSNATLARAEEAAFNQVRISAETRATASDLYVTLRTAQNQILVANESLASANDTLSLATSRQIAGLETGLGVAQATSNRDAIAARLPGFIQAETLARLGLEALLGDVPEAQVLSLGLAGAIPRFDISRANVTPAQWVRTRSDISAADRRLRAAGLDARAARLDRYPDLSLSALISETGANLGPTGQASTFSLNLLTTLFDFGRLDALARVAGAQAQTEAALYQRLVVNGLSEVETQATRVVRGQESLQAQEANIASARDQARLARVRYTSGLSTFLDVLTAERAVYDAQSARVAATGETARGEIGLILALGY